MGCHLWMSQLIPAQFPSIGMGKLSATASQVLSTPIFPARARICHWQMTNSFLKTKLKSSLSNVNGDLEAVLAQGSISCSDGFRSAQVPAVTGKLFQNIFPVMLRNLLHISPSYLLTTSLIWGQHCPSAEITLSLPWGFTWAIYRKQSLFSSPFHVFPCLLLLFLTFSCFSLPSSVFPSLNKAILASPPPPWLPHIFLCTCSILMPHSRQRPSLSHLDFSALLTLIYSSHNQPHFPFPLTDF